MSGPDLGRAIHYLVNSDTCLMGNSPAEYCLLFVWLSMSLFIIFVKTNVLTNRICLFFYEIDRL